MKWLIDEMLPRATAKELLAKGHDAVAAADLNMQGAPDADLFDRAVQEQRVMVTESFADFAALVDQRQNSGAPCTAVVYVRKSSFRSGALASQLAAQLAERLDEWATANPEPYEGLHWP